jgi:hypothetical protein
MFGVHADRMEIEHTRSTHLGSNSRWFSNVRASRARV